MEKLATAVQRSVSTVLQAAHDFGRGGLGVRMNCRILCGDWIEQLRTLPDQSVHCCVTSPPYWGLRDYGVAGQLGLEKTPEEYVAKVVTGFREVWRVLRDDGTLWLNLGSSYARDEAKGQHKPGDSGKQDYIIRHGGGRAASGGKFANPSRQRGRAPACGSDGKEPHDSSGPDSACSDLCDGCRAALSIRTAGISQQTSQSLQRDEMKVHDNGHSDLTLEVPDSFSPGVQESTTPESSQPHPEGCLHCANCGACLSVLRSSSRDARLCVRKAQCNSGISVNGSEYHNQDKGVLVKAYKSLGIPSLNFKPKDLIPIPWMVAMALQADGWYLRSDIIWSKPNPMPESVTDRPTKSHEYIFLLSKEERYYYDFEAIKEPLATKAHAPGNKMHADKISGPNDRNGHSQWETSMDKVWGESGTRNKRSVWTVATTPYTEAHFATFPPDLIKPCILAGCPVGGTVLDPFFGSGTTGMVALELGRNCIGIELNPEYVALANDRTNVTPGLQLA